MLFGSGLPSVLRASNPIAGWGRGAAWWKAEIGIGEIKMKMEDGQKGEVKCFGCKKKATERHREGRGCDGQGNAYFAEWDADGGKTPAARIFLFSFTLNTTDHLLSLNLNSS